MEPNGWVVVASQMWRMTASRTGTLRDQATLLNCASGRFGFSGAFRSRGDAGEAPDGRFLSKGREMGIIGTFWLYPEGFVCF